MNSSEHVATGAVGHDSALVRGRHADLLRRMARAAVVVVGAGGLGLWLEDIPLSRLWLVASVFLLPAVGALAAGLRRRVTVTPDEVSIRGLSGWTVVPLGAVDRVVHVQELRHPTMSGGYVALLDAEGRRLWGSPTVLWPDATVEALEDVGREHEVFGAMTPAEARSLFPGMLPWSYARPRQLLAVTAVCVVLTLVCAVVLVVVLDG